MLVHTGWVEQQRETGLESSISVHVVSSCIFQADGATLYLSRARQYAFLYILSSCSHIHSYLWYVASPEDHTYVASIEDHTYVKPDFVAPDQCWCAPGACHGCAPCCWMVPQSSPDNRVHPAPHMGVQHDSSAICTLMGAVTSKYVDMCRCNVVQVVLVSACSVYPQYDFFISCVIIIANSG
ncbi:hypothetical protein B0H11DRAFT_2061134 [Mycena galericulata]|nr:hypothetical protein B0H11DRAFT_2061134 [Mycena galericulata]